MPASMFAYRRPGRSSVTQSATQQRSSRSHPTPSKLSTVFTLVRARDARAPLLRCTVWIISVHRTMANPAPARNQQSQQQSRESACTFRAALLEQSACNLHSCTWCSAHRVQTRRSRCPFHTCLSTCASRRGPLFHVFALNKRRLRTCAAHLYQPLPCRLPADSARRLNCKLGR